MIDRFCEVSTPEELDIEIRSIAALKDYGRVDQITSGIFYVQYSDESVKLASQIPWLTNHGITIEWKKVKPLELFRNRKWRYDSELNNLSENDPRREYIEQRRMEAAYQARDLMQLESMDLCSVHDCVADGTTTESGRQWCPMHRP